MNLAILVIAICPAANSPATECTQSQPYAASTQFKCEWQAVSEQNRLSREGKFYLPAECRPLYPNEKVARR